MLCVDKFSNHCLPHETLLENLRNSPSHDQNSDHLIIKGLPFNKKQKKTHRDDNLALTTVTKQSVTKAEVTNMNAH